MEVKINYFSRITILVSLILANSYNELYSVFSTICPVYSSLLNLYIKNSILFKASKLVKLFCPKEINLLRLFVFVSKFFCILSTGFII